MSTKYALTETVATIAAKAAHRYPETFPPETAVRFAWFSSDTPGDAAEDDEDFAAHVALWLEDQDDDPRNHEVTEQDIAEHVAWSPDRADLEPLVR